MLVLKIRLKVYVARASTIIVPYVVGTNSNIFYEDNIISTLLSFRPMTVKREELIFNMHYFIIRSMINYYYKIMYIKFNF